MSGILKPVVALYGLKVIETNLGWYVSEGVLTPEAGRAVPQQIRLVQIPPCNSCHFVPIYAWDCFSTKKLLLAWSWAAFGYR